MKLTETQLRKIIREFTEEEQAMLDAAAALTGDSEDSLEDELKDIRQAEKDRAAGRRVGTLAKEKVVDVSAQAAEGMVKNQKGRNKLANLIESGGTMPEKLRNWLIDSVCGASQSIEDIAASDSKVVPIAKKICRVLGQGATLVTGGMGTIWLMSKLTPYVADFLRNLSDEEAAAIWDFTKEVVAAAKDDGAGGAEVKKENHMRITKRQLKRIIREEKTKLLEQPIGPEQGRQMQLDQEFRMAQEELLSILGSMDPVNRNANAYSLIDDLEDLASRG